MLQNKEDLKNKIIYRASYRGTKEMDILNFIGLQNCGHLPHVDLPSLSSKIIQDYFLE